jgi:GTP-binding protein Era
VDELTPGFRSGTVALAGRPNAGKSTLLNAILGQKLAITSPKPQTTRNRIVGIHTTDRVQMVLVDTPGIHPAKSRLNRAMVEVATSAIVDVDVICLVVDAHHATQAMADGKHALSKGDEALAQYVEQARRVSTPGAFAGDGAVVVALNKIDIVAKPALLPLLDAWSKRLPTAALVPVSARKAQGLDSLLAEWEKALPEAPPLYPVDQVTEHPEKFFVAEIIREKVVMLTHQELPYATAVEVESFDETAREAGGRVRIHARILVARDSQKGIVIGKGGQLLKKINALAHKEIESFLGARAHLDLHVVLKKEWTEDERVLRALGYAPVPR